MKHILKLHLIIFLSKFCKCMLFSLFFPLLGMRASTTRSFCNFLMFSERSGTEMGHLLQGGETRFFTETLSFWI